MQGVRPLIRILQFAIISIFPLLIEAQKRPKEQKCEKKSKKKRRS